MRTRGLDYINSCEFWKGNRNFGLNNIRGVLEALGNPQDLPKSMHVAGTNGKGSVAVSTAAMLGGMGFSVGLITSPHLQRVNERIVIDGWPISDSLMDEKAARVQQASWKTGLKLSYFEAVTATAFLSMEHLDWIVVEVGLGGRLDASNVLKKPEVNSIVTVGYDHQDILGNTIEEIAAEKAGIIKKGGKVVVGPVSHAALDVISRMSIEKGCSVAAFGKDYNFKEEPGKKGIFLYQGLGGKEVVIRPKLLGKYQAENTAVALAMLESAGFFLDDGLSSGIDNAFWPGRLEKINAPSGDFYFDCAHNLPGVNSLLSFIKNSDIGKIEAGFGVLAKKRWQEMVDLLFPYIVKWHIMQPPTERALPVQELEDYLQQKGASVVNYGQDYSRFRNWVQSGEREVPCFVFGSVYLLGELRSLFTDRFGPLWLRGENSSSLLAENAS